MIHFKANVRDLSAFELDTARAEVGEVKLWVRQTCPERKWSDLLRPLNARIDEINAEDTRRQLRR